MRGKAREARTVALFHATVVSYPPLEDVNYGDTVFYLYVEGGGGRSHAELSKRQTPSYLLHYIYLKYYVSFGIQTGFSV